MILKSGTGQQRVFQNDFKQYTTGTCDPEDPPSLLMIARLDAPINLADLEALTKAFWTWQPHCAFKLTFDSEIMFDYPAKCMAVPITALDYSALWGADFSCQLEPSSKSYYRVVFLLWSAESTEAECFVNQVQLPMAFNKKLGKKVRTILTEALEEPPEIKVTINVQTLDASLDFKSLF